MVQRTTFRHGLSLTEVIVSVVCLLLILAITIPWLLNVRGTSRDMMCLNRLRALSDAVIEFSNHEGNALPYLVEERSWPVAVSSYLQLPGVGRNGKVAEEDQLKALSVPRLVCPDDPRARTEKTGALSYVINAGYGLFPVDSETNSVTETGTHRASIDLNGDGVVSSREWMINYSTGVCWRPDSRPAAEAFRMSLPYVSNRDGLEFTLLLSENLNAGNWLSHRTMDVGYVIGRERLTFASEPDGSAPLDLEAADLGPFAPNADLGTLPGRCPAPSSLHGEYVYATYCDGHGGPLSAKIDSLAYARLMTPNGSQFGEGGAALKPPIKD